MYSTKTADNGARTDSSSSSSDSSTASARAVDTSFSDTNVRTESVDEADIVKTDGSYLYTLKANSQEISIVDIRTGSGNGADNKVLVCCMVRREIDIRLLQKIVTNKRNIGRIIFFGDRIVNIIVAEYIQISVFKT